MNGQVSCEGPMGKTSLFDVEALSSVDPATRFRKDDMTPKVRYLLSVYKNMLYIAYSIL